MELPIVLQSVEEYEYAVSRGYQPLQDWKKFTLHVPLRIDLQRALFGKSHISKGNVVEANQRFYYWCWDNNPHFCEECAHPLHDYSSVYVSHILSRGAHPESAHDPRNKNMLCPGHHRQWENEQARKQMKIYKSNLFIIEILKKDYQ